MMNSTVVALPVVGLLRAASRLGLTMTLLLALHGAQAADFIYTVQPGDHPWNLAQRYLKRPALSARLLELNQVPDEHRMMPGTRLRIPHAWLKLQSAEVRLLAVYGETAMVQGASPARLAVPGELMAVQSVLRTGATGSATLGFADGSRVLLRRDSELRLAQAQQRALGKVGLVELVLLAGSLENQVTPLGESGGRFEIRTPAAVAAVRGTDFRLHTHGSKARTEVLSGAVSLTNAQGQIRAEGGQGSVVEGGQSPTPPMPLLGAPSLDGVPERVQRLPIDLPLRALNGAIAYRTQLAPDANFNVAVSDEVSTSPRLRARDVPDGTYVMRVRATDAHGLEGLSAQRTLVVHARPEPPLLIAPTSQAVTEAARPLFRWTQAEPTWRYLLQVMDSVSGDIVDEQSVAGGLSPAPQLDLPAGRYRWRVAAIDPQKGQGPWGDAQEFRRVLPGPGVEPAEVSDGALTLRWSAQPQAARYRLQVARDDTFSAPLVDLLSESPQHRMTELTPGEHQVRVQAIGADGYTGPWGGTQRFVAPEASRQPWWALLLLLPLLGLF